MKSRAIVQALSASTKDIFTFFSRAVHVSGVRCSQDAASSRELREESERLLASKDKKQQPMWVDPKIKFQKGARDMQAAQEQDETVNKNLKKKSISSPSK